MGVGNLRVLLSVRERSDAGLSDGCCPIGIPHVLSGRAPEHFNSIEPCFSVGSVPAFEARSERRVARSCER